MKSGDKLRMMALRSVLSEMSRLEKDVRRDPNDAEILQIIKRERAKREETLEFARKAARQDLIDQNETEAKVLESYLPAAASADEVRAEIAACDCGGRDADGPDHESVARQVRRRPRRQGRQRAGQRSAREEVARKRYNSLRNSPGYVTTSPRLSTSMSRVKSLSIDSYR